MKFLDQTHDLPKELDASHWLNRIDQIDPDSKKRLFDELIKDSQHRRRMDWVREIRAAFPLVFTIIIVVAISIGYWPAALLAFPQMAELLSRLTKRK